MGVIFLIANNKLVSKHRGIAGEDLYVIVRIEITDQVSESQSDIGLDQLWCSELWPPRLRFLSFL